MNHFIFLLANATDSIIGGANQACGNDASCNRSTTVGSLFTSASNILIFLVGSISVIMIIVGGFKYVTSGGDAKATASAKATITYAVIGIVVSLVAYSVVNFVITNVK